MQGTNLALIAQKQAVTQQAKSKSSDNSAQFSFVDAAREIAFSHSVVAPGIDTDELDLFKYRFPEQGEEEDSSVDTPYDTIAEIRKLIRQGSDPLVKGLEEIK